MAFEIKTPSHHLSLPSPDTSDEELLEAEVLHYQAMDSTNYTTVRNSSKRLYTYSFTMDTKRLLELRELFEEFRGYPSITIIDHESTTRTVKFVNDDLDTTHTRRAGNRREFGTVTLEFIDA
jgi:hypothetical protein